MEDFLLLTYISLITISYLMSFYISYTDVSIKEFKFFSAISPPLMALAFLAGGMFDGFLASLLVAIRNIVAYFEKDLTYIFLTSSIILFYFTSDFKSYYDILPLMAVLVMTYAIFKLDLYKIKFSVLISSIFWVLYLIHSNANLALFFQSIVLVSILGFWAKLISRKIKYKNNKEFDNEK